MARTCIVTDSTAQFPAPVYAGSELVCTVPLRIKIGNAVYTDGKDIKTSNLPASASELPGLKVLPPSVEDFQQTFLTLGKQYREIIVLLLSSQLNPAVETAKKASELVKGPINVHVIDSQTTAVGLGLLVQAAAEAALRGKTAQDIQQYMRGLLPRVYTVFSARSLSYLSLSGHLDQAQAIIGEMLAINPFFIMESGRLLPIQKVRNQRHLVDLLEEFVTEFGNLKHIAFLQGVPPMEQEARSLRDRVNNSFPGTGFSEHHIGPALAAILGPRSIGMVAMENTPSA